MTSFLLLAPAARPVESHAGVASSNAAVCDAPQPRLPPSVRLQDGLEPVVRRTLAHSPTFRQQCRVLAAAQKLSVTVGVFIRPVGTARRARAQFRPTPSGGIAGTIEIYPTTDLPELLGHEFEHVIEQLDGIDLQRASRDGGARRMDDGAFETARAVAAGRRVSGEVADTAPDRVRRAGRQVWRALRRVM